MNIHSISPVLSTDMLSGSTGVAGANNPAKLKAACKAIEGIFTSQLMSEIGKSDAGSDDSQSGGMYQDFIQQALSQGISNGGGFGLAKTLETSLTPAAHQHHQPANLTHVATTPTTAS